MMKRILLSLGFALAIVSALVAQDARRVLYLADFSPDSNFSAEQQRVIRESLLLRLQNDVDSVDFILSEDQSNVDDLNYIQQAVLNSADSVLIAAFSGDMDGLTAVFQIIDALVGEQTASFSVTGPVDSQYRNLFGGFWYEAVQQLETSLNPIQDKAILSIKVLPGSRITVPHASPEGDELIMKNTGEAVSSESAELPIPASYTVIVEKDGYFTEEEKIFLTESRILDISSRQEAVDRLYIQPALQMFSFTRLGFGFTFNENRIRLGLDVVNYTLGIQPFQHSDSNNPDPSLIVSLPLVSMGVSGSFSFPVVPWNLPFQPYVEAVFSVRFLTETKLIVDALFPLELRIEPGIEWQINRHVQLFAGISPTFSFLTNPDFQDLIPRDNNDQYTKIKPWLYLSGPAPLIGVRIGL